MSSSTALPDFDSLSNLFIQIGALGSPSELHGTLCGFLTAGRRWSTDDWLKQSAQLLDIDVPESAQAKTALAQLYDVTLRQLEEGVFEFTLIVPDDDYAVAQRSQALGSWCYGFLHGYGMGGGQVDENLDEDARESIQDLSRFTQLSDMALEEQESDEADLMELLEYVRVVAIMLFTACNQQEQPVNPNRTLH
ncbi:UPF0149 family protein [Pokkaliibacter plantistimulans]|uniref:YecA family protein n=1 Tax=Proteobacteria bacterium 228 TaxID=2083153 RepID=A0A2S5KKM8_9PROT|nr:UPF0149 family protein [Pokkaliibacter plantistimulans]PPC75282.1 hypothetical protein C4K68_21855 [Pokkaliibacter plantistimulans]